MKKCLIVVDYQNDFVDGALGFSGAELLEEKILQKIEDYKDQDIVFTFDTHSADYLKTREGQNLPVPHCIKDSAGWALYGKLGDHLSIARAVFEKNTFGSLDLAQFLQEQQYDTVELVGLVSNICVLSNAVLAKAALPEAEIIVDASCTGSHDQSMHEKALNILQGIHIQIINR